MSRRIRIHVSMLFVSAGLCAAGDKVSVPADPSDDPSGETIMLEGEPQKKVTKKTRTITRQAAVPATKPAAPAGKDASVQVNTINVYEQQRAARNQEDSLALARAREDAATLAAKARHDSLALAESERRLSWERSRRSEMENQLLTTGLLVLDAVYFETARTDISINSKPYLDMLAKMLTKYPKLKIEVAGHTDHVGGEAYNLNLSQGRAASVMSYLISAEPSLGGRLASQGYGESSPKADNNTADGRMRNRRTELQVLNKEALEEYNRPGPQARGEAEMGVGGSEDPKQGRDMSPGF